MKPASATSNPSPKKPPPPSPEATENDVSTMRDIQEEAISELPKEASPIAASDEPVEAVIETKTAPQPARSPEEDDDDHQSAQEKPASASSHDGFSAFSSLSSARNDLSDGLASLPEPASSPESTKEVPSPVKSDENEKVESPPAAITSPNSVESVQEEIEQHDEPIPSGNLSSDPERLPSSENSGIFPSGIVSSNLLEDSPVPSPPKPEPQVADETTDVPDEASKTTSVSGEASSTTSSATKSKLRCERRRRTTATIHFQQIKKINSYVLPVEYHARFYTEVVNAGEYAKLAYFNDSVVGAVCCRREHKEGRNRLYIMMIGVLAPYRRFGVGSMLLSHVMALCENDTQIESVFLHVQSNNDEAIQFYKKFGFEVIDRVDNYYKRITPDDAFLLEKVVNNGTKSATVSNTANCGDIMAE